MKKLPIIFIILLFALPVYAVTSTFTDTGDHLWGTAANWDNGVPDATVDAVISAGTTDLNLGSTARTCKTFTATGTSGMTITGSAQMSVSGNFTIDSNVTWNTTGNLYMVAAGTFTTGDATITCAIWGDNGQSGAKTLTVGNSTINCSNVSWAGANTTVTANTATINVRPTGTVLTYFGGQAWGGTISFIFSGSAMPFLLDANTFGNLIIDFSALTDGGTFVVRGATTIVTNTFAIISYCNATSGVYGKPWINSSIYEVGVQKEIVVNGSVSITGAVDFRDIKGGGSASWDFSDLPVGNAGGNSGITFRSPQTFYLVLGNNSGQFYGNGGRLTVPLSPSYATTSGGATSWGNIPLPQDTLIIDNNTWGVYSGHYFLFHYNTRACNVDASQLTNAGNELALPSHAYGNIDYSGSGIAIRNQILGGTLIDPRVKSESGSDLLLNMPVAFTPGQGIWLGGANGTFSRNGSGIGTIKLLSNINITTLNFVDSAFDLNGKTVIANSFVSNDAFNRSIKDTTGGGKIILTGLSGTLFDTTNPTGLTISNAPDIQIGDGTKTLTGNVTFIGSGKTFGDFTIKKHAGDFDCIITGSNTFGALTLETPDATYQYSDLQLTAGTTQTITSIAGTGTSLYKPKLLSTSGGTPATISDSSGTNAVNYLYIKDITASGGATFTMKNYTNGGNNTGWNYTRGIILQ